MACPDGPRYTGFQTAMENLDIWEALYCTYGTAAGELVVGGVFYSAVGLAIYIRTGSAIVPLVLTLILGSTITAQMLSVISSFVALIILLGAPLIAALLAWKLDRRA